MGHPQLVEREKDALINFVKAQPTNERSAAIAKSSSRHLREKPGKERRAGKEKTASPHRCSRSLGPAVERPWAFSSTV